MRLPKRTHRRRNIGLFVAGVLVCGALAAGLWLARSSNAPATASEQPAVLLEKPVVARSISSNMLVFGNAFWGRNLEDWSMTSSLKTAYPFSRLDEFNRSKYDAWIAGLECPTDPDVHMTAAEQEAQLQFNCSPEFLPEAAKWFTAFTLANNHTDNQGEEGFTKTKTALEQNGIQYFGHYDPRVLSDVCEVISLPVSIQNDNATDTKGQLPVALCGYHGVFRIPSEAALAEMEQYSKIMPVIAFPHMGLEYQPVPDQLKIDTYHAMIDHGADMVLGDHPHWIQNTESYKGHLIVYSMGNFMFDQQDTPEVVRSAAIQVNLKTKKTDSVLLEKWLKLGESCKLFHDDCLTQAGQMQLTKLPVSYQFGVVGTNDSNKITKPATAGEQASILQRLNWSQTMSQLQSPYSGL